VLVGTALLRAAIATTAVGPVDTSGGSRLEPSVHIGERAGVSADDVAGLVRAARAGDRAAFATLYQRFARAVHAVILTRAPYRDAADLVQDVFVIALERLDQLGEPAAFGGWILAIARTRSIDHVRRVHKVQPTELVEEPEAPAVPTAEAQRVLDAIRALPEAYRETIAMRLVEGMTGPEIAERTGLSPGSVRVNLHRGMKLLRERLSDAPAPERPALREADHG
jgi:RNA polymerase sigma-70 factor (ECF subfamily)